MSTHIGAKPGEIAETVLLPGDPYRARWAAQSFLEAPVLVNEVRGMLGYTGTWRGNRVTIHGTGMGMPSLSIYANELIRDHGAKTLIRIGSAGGMQDHVRVRDVVLAMSACTTGSPSATLLREICLAPTADFALLRAAWDAGQRLNVGLHAGQIYSSDTFYDERPDLNDQMRRHGILCVEMETAELYALAARHGCRALAVLTISDHLLTQEALPAADRERSFGDMVQIALEAAFA
ncbi:MAG: purine-nucleoside phosphorylase [Paracoccaceae bacterium]